jgi:hypothetical protein
MKDMGCLSEAEILQEEVLAKTRMILGANHPDVFTALYDLATTFQELDNAPRALPLLSEALSISTLMPGLNPLLIQMTQKKLSRLAGTVSPAQMSRDVDACPLQSPQDAKVYSPKPNSRDAVIVVLGLTGAGKSRFIRAATGDTAINAQPSLMSGILNTVPSLLFVSLRVLHSDQND